MIQNEKNFFCWPWIWSTQNFDIISIKFDSKATNCNFGLTSISRGNRAVILGSICNEQLKLEWSSLLLCMLLLHIFFAILWFFDFMTYDSWNRIWGNASNGNAWSLITKKRRQNFFRTWIKMNDGGVSNVFPNSKLK